MKLEFQNAPRSNTSDPVYYVKLDKTVLATVTMQGGRMFMHTEPNVRFDMDELDQISAHSKQIMESQRTFIVHSNIVLKCISNIGNGTLYHLLQVAPSVIKLVDVFGNNRASDYSTTWLSPSSGVDLSPIINGFNSENFSMGTFWECYEIEPYTTDDLKRWMELGRKQ
jgi:hypothetical protein